MSFSEDNNDTEEYIHPSMQDVESFIGVKGLKAKGKRLHTWNIEKIEELEPLRFPEPENEQKVEEEETSPESSSGPDENGQMSLF